MTSGITVSGHCLGSPQLNSPPADASQRIPSGNGTFATPPSCDGIVRYCLLALRRASQGLVAYAGAQALVSATAANSIAAGLRGGTAGGGGQAGMDLLSH